MISIVGYSGFVGSNLCASFDFDGKYDKSNIADAFGTNPDVVFYSGVPAQKFIANKFPQEDFKTVQEALDNMKKINPKKVVLISSVDVYKAPNGKDEDSFMDKEDLHPYGANRLWLEEQVKANFEDYFIVRLPGLYGINLKKNFIFDYLNFIPSMLNETKFSELAAKEPKLKEFYSLQDNGFWKLNEGVDRTAAKKMFEELGFSALNFTDSRGIFQYYNLKYLYKNIQTAIENGVKVLNIATEPVTISEIYNTITGKEFVNELGGPVPHYDFKTKNFEIFGGKDGYIQTKEFVLNDIKEFIAEMQK
ncbi:MAG: NAD(P)-dependent oxidoreductase [Ruminococcaceae bacterium]|nr:NAD(P)-dependent oxidoreductase [Oscillospiraceae bacterium]